MVLFQRRYILIYLTIDVWLSYRPDGEKGLIMKPLFLWAFEFVSKGNIVRYAYTVAPSMQAAKKALISRFEDATIYNCSKWNTIQNYIGPGLRPAEVGFTGSSQDLVSRIADESDISMAVELLLLYAVTGEPQVRTRKELTSRSRIGGDF